KEKPEDVKKALLEQAKAIAGGVEVDPEILAKTMIEKRRIGGGLVGIKFKDAVDAMEFADFVEIAKEALNSHMEEVDPSKQKTVLTERDIPDLDMDDIDRM
ncbi:MAG: hypothetical protein U9O20_00380, partial [Patescibacteria group bacterium]|nr:hypothetical protein [Patescibacteria group bacterium]